MKLLRTKAEWDAFIELNGFNSPDVLKEPKSYPCYAYEHLDSIEFQWTSPAYLYAKELKIMLKHFK